MIQLGMENFQWIPAGPVEDYMGYEYQFFPVTLSHDSR